jgi:hypothetical protein
MNALFHEVIKTKTLLKPIGNVGVFLLLYEMFENTTVVKE